MKEAFSQYDLMRFEFFEYLLPQLVYTGTDQQKEEIYGYLREDGPRFILEMFETMCAQDHIPCPYRETVFAVTVVKRGGVEIIRIDPPPYNPSHNDVIRAYVLSAKEKDGTSIRKYFTIRYFVEGEICIMYVDVNGEVMINEELNKERREDIEYEYWRVVRCFAWGYIRDIRAEKKKKRKWWRKNPDKP